uniref:Uncharacterized protein n=1 Tax=Rhizophora mucronata TaxID=61149 RepID=A0A2P2KK04_RHIMU
MIANQLKNPSYITHACYPSNLIHP